MIQNTEILDIFQTSDQFNDDSPQNTLIGSSDSDSPRNLVIFVPIDWPID